MNGLFTKYILLNIQLSFLLILESLTRFERVLMYLPYSVIIRDKVGNFGQFDDKTLFGNKSNLHTTRAFTHNISH